MASASPLLVSNVIRAPKQDVRITDWEQGPVPRAKFPLLRSKLPLGRGWRWRTVRFRALGEEFVVLVALSREKESYRAVLAMVYGNTLKVLCHHELHTDHWNWHCHVVRGDIHKTHPGVLRDKCSMSAWPIFSTDECSVSFDVTEENALTIAAERYRFTRSGGFL